MCTCAVRPYALFHHLLICPPIASALPPAFGPSSLSSNAALCNITFCILLRPTHHPHLPPIFCELAPPSHPAACRPPCRSCMPWRPALLLCFLHSCCSLLPAILLLCTLSVPVLISTLLVVTLPNSLHGSSSTGMSAKLGRCREKQLRARLARPGARGSTSAAWVQQEQRLLSTELGMNRLHEVERCA